MSYYNTEEESMQRRFTVADLWNNYKPMPYIPRTYDTPIPYSNGRMFTNGKKHKSLKSRSNRRKRCI